VVSAITTATERLTTTPKFENPAIIVQESFLDLAFAMQRQGCPVHGCGKPFVSHVTNFNGCAAKVIFRCKKGHPWTWSSCEQLGRQSLLLNPLVPAAAVMSGLKIAPTKRFLGLLQVDTHDAYYMKSSSLDLLMRLTQQLYEKEVALVQEEMMEGEFFDLGTSYILLFALCVFTVFYFIFLSFLSSSSFF
jgi:hypothetical protein